MSINQKKIGTFERAETLAKRTYMVVMMIWVVHFFLFFFGRGVSGEKQKKAKELKLKGTLLGWLYIKVRKFL